MPVIVAVGVNLGVVPLLFIQLAYYKVFYPATILMAWFWLGIIMLLIPAYYGVYAYAMRLRGENDPDSLLRNEQNSHLRFRNCLKTSGNRRRLVLRLALPGDRLFVRQRAEPDGPRRAAGPSFGSLTARPARRRAPP